MLCSEHFAKDCFERDFASEFKHKSTKELYRIKDDAVPSIFSHTSSPSPRVSSENRSAKATKRKMTRGLCDGPSLPSSTVPNSSSDDNSTPSYSRKEVEVDQTSDKFPVTTYDEPITEMVDVAVNTDLSFAPYTDIIFDVPARP